MKHKKITRNEINKITMRSPPRERAFFTFIRQSGLEISEIQKLKIRDVERILDPNPPIPCRINTLTKSPTFIGYEAVKHLKNYLDKRARQEKKLTAESLLFTAKTNPNKEINTKRVSIVFKEKAVKIGNPDLELRSLIEFYKNSTEEYQKELKELGNDSTPNDDEFYRELYKEKAMPSLEIELPTPMEMHRLETQNKELAQRITEIADKFLPIESEISAEETGETRFEWFERWLREHPEEKKRLEKQQQEQQKSHCKYLELYPEAKKIDPQIDAKIKQLQKFYTEHLDYTVWELRNKLKDIIKEHKKTQRKHSP